MGKTETTKKRNIFLRIYDEYPMLLVLIALLIIGGILSPSFFSKINIMNIFRQNAVTGIVSLGVLFVVLGGTLDMSVGSIMSLTGLLALMLQEHIGVAGAMIVAILAGAVIGLTNGLIIAGINGYSGESFMVTFGMTTLVQGLALILTNGNMLLGSNSKFYNFLGDGNVFKIVPFSIVLFFAFSIIIGIFLAKSKKGREIYYMGSNPVAARLAGLNIKRLRILVYVISGCMAAIAAILLTGRTHGMTPTAGKEMEFDAITALAVGGIGVSGGEGTVIHAIIGVLIMGVIGNVMKIIGISSQNQLIVKGVVLVLAVILDNIKKKKA